MQLLVNLIVQNITPNYTDLQWVILDQENFLKNIVKEPIKGFNLYYSENPESLVKVNQEIIDGYFYHHVTFNYDKFKNHYYKIELVTDSDKKIESPIMTIYPKMLKAMFNVMRTHLFELVCNVSDIVNIPVLFYQKRTSGILCSSCGINKSMGSIRSKCPTCEGTGYEGGYYPPVLAWVDYKNANNKDVQDQGVIKMQPSNRIATTSSFFIVPKVNDYFRELIPPFRLYCVGQIAQESETGNQPVSTIMAVQQEDSNHPLYGKKVPFSKSLNNRIYWDKMFLQINEIRNEIRAAINAS